MKREHIHRIIFFIGLILLYSNLLSQTTATFNYTGAVQTWCVPPGVTSVTIDMAGGGGGKGYRGAASGTGGKGARVQATLAVTPGNTLNLYVAGAGGNAANSTVGGVGGWGGNGDENGGAGYGDNGNTNWANSWGDGSGGGGGGASAIRLSTATAFANDILSSAGGGGSGNEYAGAVNGGNGGGIGSLPTIGGYGCSSSEAGTVGTAGAAGAATNWYCSFHSNGLAGSNGNGGGGGYSDAADCYCDGDYSGGGGGGGGHYAGGGGCMGGGGGGYSYTSGAGVSGVTVTSGFQTGNGYIKITYTVSTPGAISGTTSQCPNLTGQVYSITAVSGETSYNWTVPTGWTITAGGTTNSITVTTGAVGQNGNITVNATSSCGTTNNSTLAVTVVSCCSAPTTQASSVTFSSVQCTQMTVGFTSGNGSSRLVVAKSGSAVSGTPSNNTTYTANTVFGSGSTIAAGEYVVYSGSGNSVTVTGLTSGT